MANRLSISKAECYRNIGDYWDQHDATESGKQEPAEFDVNLVSQRHYVAIDHELRMRIRILAKRRGISDETLVNLFLRDRIEEVDRGRQP
ncbi:hypothetical protein Thimo_1024 [Thioflavicoccus mobilis 8321]|uniref:Uncharacterized protein n=1 Tax=Thioflavicoccus mobilis 8321 TaxID=765912 RepID=L0GSU1_9GAMM|nr:CopG family antitoxin [Thioflavicoccus mobilis]AGA89838.1 hypothetical protein Thimo_1024 [Thioflavicoccus mobilis 8321]